MHLKYTFPMLFLLLAFFTACSERPPLSGSERPPISGSVTMDASGQWKPVVYLIDPKTWNGIAGSFMGTVIDSATIQSDGRFVFSKMPDSPEPRLFELAIQRMDGEFFANRLDDEDIRSSNYFPIVYKNGETIVVNTVAWEFQRNFGIEEGQSPDNKAMLELRNLRQAAFDKFLNSDKDNNSHDEAALLDEEKAMLSYKKAMMQFAIQTQQMLPALTAIRWVSVEGDYERIPEFIVEQAERWQKEAPEHPWVKQLAAKGDRKTLPVLVGDQIPMDYQLPMLAGDTVALKELMSGKKLVLLDLWASWCAPCRKENRNTLVPLWEKYNGQGFQIVGYALDASKGAWSTAIEKDGVNRWPHASHLQGDDAPLFKELRMTTIPANFLLDENGKVLAKNLHGDELVDRVKGYFK